MRGQSKASPGSSMGSGLWEGLAPSPLAGGVIRGRHKAFLGLRCPQIPLPSHDNQICPQGSPDLSLQLSLQIQRLRKTCV